MHVLLKAAAAALILAPGTVQAQMPAASESSKESTVLDSANGTLGKIVAETEDSLTVETAQGKIQLPRSTFVRAGSGLKANVLAVDVKALMCAEKPTAACQTSPR